MRTKKKIPKAEPRVLDAEGTVRLAFRNGIRLEVPKDEDIVRATAVEGIDYATVMTEELADNIRRNKPELMRYLLLKQAFTYLNEHHVRGADLSALKAPGDRVDEAEGMASYREAIREYVRVGLREFTRARRAQRSAS